jgi:hypothetical protein
VAVFDNQYGQPGALLRSVCGGRTTSRSTREAGQGVIDIDQNETFRRSPDERSDIRVLKRQLPPHVASLMRATFWLLVGQIRFVSLIVPRSKRSRRSENRMRRKTDFASGFNPISPVQPLRQKYLYFFLSEFMYSSPYPASCEGRIAIVTDVEAGSGGRGVSRKTSAAPADGQVAWS